MKPIIVLKHVLRRGTMAVSNYTPEILMGVGTAAFGGTIFMAVKAAPTIEDALGRAIEDSRHYESKPKRVAYIASKVAPVAAPTALMGAAALACFFGAHRIQVKRQIALASLYSMASQTLNSYQDKIIEELGTEKHQNILERVLKDDEPLPDAGKDISAFEGEGDILVYDRVTGRYFRATPEKIREAEGKVSKRMVDEIFVPLNFFYEQLGLEDCSFIGEAVGWDIDKCRIDVAFRATLDESDRPCLMIVYNTTILDANALRAR